MAESLLQPGDPIIAIDLDPPRLDSAYPGGEEPANVLDGTASTKYLNFGGEGSGFIVTPQVGATVLQSFMLTTANDVPERDPAGWELWGTNEPIKSTDNSLGDGEVWTPIANGSVALPDSRLTDGPLVAVANSALYSSYRLVFTALKDSTVASLMQVADVRFFENQDGGLSFLSPGDAILAIDVEPATDSDYPSAEGPPNAIDGGPAKYLNFGAERSGFIVTPSVGATIVSSFTITTANDLEERDPASWELYGTDDPIVSLDNSQAAGEAWILIDAGSIALPDTRLTDGPEVFLSNSTPYRSYRMVFPTLKNAVSANSMQIAEIQFDGCTCFFADGFESGDTSAWSSVQPVLVLETNELERPGDVYWGAFEVDRAALAHLQGRGWLIVGSGTGGGGRIGELFGVAVRRLRGTLELRLRARLDDGSFRESPWTSLPRDARWLELRWRRALPKLRDGEIALHVDGDLRAVLHDLVNAAAPLTAIAVARDRELTALVHERSSSLEEAK